MEVLNESNLFTGNKRCITDELNLESSISENLVNKIKKFESLGDSVVVFLSITQLLHIRNHVKLYGPNIKEVKYVSDLFMLKDNDITQTFLKFKTLDINNLLDVYKGAYDRIIREPNIDGIFSVREFLIFLEFKNKAKSYYQEALNSLKSECGVKFSKYIYIVEQVSKKSFTGVSRYINPNLVREIHTVELTDNDKNSLKRLVDNSLSSEIIGFIHNLLDIMKSDDFIGSEFDTKEAMELKKVLNVIAGK